MKNVDAAAIIGGGSGNPPILELCRGSAKHWEPEPHPFATSRALATLRGRRGASCVSYSVSSPDRVRKIWARLQAGRVSNAKSPSSKKSDRQ